MSPTTQKAIDAFFAAPANAASKKKAAQSQKQSDKDSLNGLLKLEDANNSRKIPMKRELKEVDGGDDKDGTKKQEIEPNNDDTNVNDTKESKNTNESNEEKPSETDKSGNDTTKGTDTTIGTDQPNTATDTATDQSTTATDTATDNDKIEIGGILCHKDQPLPYAAITNTFDKLESTPKRLEINSICSDFFLQVLRGRAHELPRIVYLFTNRLGPDYEGLELGLGESLIMKALGEATGRSTTQLRNDYRKLGDLGLVAMRLKSSQQMMFAPPKPLTAWGVFDQLKEIAKAAGSASQSRKIEIIKKLLTACKGNEAKYLVRSLEGKLRIGVAEKSVLVGLSQAFVAWEKEKKSKKSIKASSEEVSRGEELIKDAFCQVPNYEILIDAMINHGIEHVAEICKVKAGIPMRPMLAKPTKSITEVLDRFHGEKFTCEYKYDGERAQLHSTGDGKFYVYSRNMEDMTERYPDVISVLPKISKEASNKSFIIDSEAVAWDRDAKKILPFQVLSTRKRKDVEEGSIKVRVCLFAFDILYFDGESLLQKPFEERREILHSHFSPIVGEFNFATFMNSEETEEIQEFLDQSVKDSCEGLMVKVLDGPESGYEPSKRSRNWLKLKKDYLSGIGDTLDLVVLGAYFGRGKRTSWYGGYLLGCYNADTEEYETICKIGTGFSEADLEQFYNKLSPTVTEDAKSYVSYTEGASPDVWFEPSMVWEILSADLSLSPVYKAGINELGKGVSLRFPRFLRVREDKNPEDATTSDEVVQFYQNQGHVKG